MNLSPRGEKIYNEILAGFKAVILKVALDNFESPETELPNVAVQCAQDFVGLLEQAREASVVRNNNKS